MPIIVLGVLALSGCSDQADKGQSITQRDSAGVAIVENAASPWAEAKPWHVGRDPVLTIGSIDDPDLAKLFTNIRGLTRLRDGSIVVVEGQTSEVRWFDAAGVHIATRGGRGRGPGEFTSITTLIRLPGDTVLVQDAPLVRQVFFAPSTEYVREERIDFARYRSYGRWLECLNVTLPDRSLLGCQPEPGQQSAASNTPGRLRTFARYVRVPWSMEGAYRLGLYGGIEQWGVADSNGQVRYAVHPFHAATVAAAGGTPLRVAIALNPEYSLEIWSPDGRLERIIRRVAARRAPSRRQAAEARDEIWPAYSDQALMNRLIAEMPAPDSIPAVGGLVFGPAGDLWVTRARLFSSTDSTVVDIFSNTGRFLGDLRLPPRLYLFEVGIDYLLAARLDGDDVPTVELYSLARN